MSSMYMKRIWKLSSGAWTGRPPLATCSLVLKGARPESLKASSTTLLGLEESSDIDASYHDGQCNSKSNQQDV